MTGPNRTERLSLFKRPSAALGPSPGVEARWPHSSHKLRRPGEHTGGRQHTEFSSTSDRQLLPRLAAPRSPHALLPRVLPGPHFPGAQNGLQRGTISLPLCAEVSEVVSSRAAAAPQVQAPQLDISAGPRPGLRTLRISGAQRPDCAARGPRRLAPLPAAGSMLAQRFRQQAARLDRSECPTAVYSPE